MRFQSRCFLASAMLAVAVFATPGLSASAASPTKITNCVKAASAPKLLTLACGDGNTVLKGLVWSSFGQATARARGTLLTNTCQPDCAEGKDVSYPVTVTAASPRACKGVLRVYGKLTLRFTSRAPGPGVPRSWTLGCPT
jgi:hypothetical protein